jgi:hypothetical protein
MLSIRVSGIPHRLAWLGILFRRGSYNILAVGIEELRMHTHPPIDPDDPSGASGEDVREPPLPGTQGTPREEFPRKGDLVDPEPAANNK